VYLHNVQFSLLVFFLAGFLFFFYLNVQLIVSEFIIIIIIKAFKCFVILTS